MTCENGFCNCIHKYFGNGDVFPIVKIIYWLRCYYSVTKQKQLKNDVKPRKGTKT